MTECIAQMVQSLYIMVERIGVCLNAYSGVIVTRTNTLLAGFASSMEQHAREGPLVDPNRVFDELVVALPSACICLPWRSSFSYPTIAGEWESAGLQSRQSP
jgi:hypothetical protein